LPPEESEDNDAFTVANLFTELERLQRQMSTLFDGLPSSLRSGRFDAFPQVNVGSTDETVEIVAFAPGLDPAKLDVSIDKDLVVLAGEPVTRDGALPEGTREYARERFTGASPALSDERSSFRSTPTRTRYRRATSTVVS
jgi:HSP20 family protein